MHLYRYLGGLFLRYFVALYFILSAVVALFDFAELQRRSSTRTLITFMDKIEMVGLKNMSIIMMIIPFIVLISCMLMFWRLNRQQEVVATKSLGLSIWQFLMPVAVVCAGISAVEIGVLNPLSAHFLTQYESKAQGFFDDKKDQVSVSEGGLWLRHKRPDGAYQMIQMRTVSQDFQESNAITINQFSNDHHFEKRIEAQSGRFTEEGLLLTKGWRTLSHQQPKSFKTFLLVGTIHPEHIFPTALSPGSMSFWTLKSLLPLLRESGLSANRYELSYQATMAKLVWPLMMVLLAAGFSLRHTRHGGGITLLFQGIALTFFLYLLRDFVFAMGLAGTLSLTMAAWLPALLTGLIGTSILLYREEG